LAPQSNLTSGRLLARNAIINVVSDGIPFLVAIFVIPALIGQMGVDRYGVLTLSMMMVGYFGLFDFGLGRASTKYIAEAAGKGELDAVPGLFWTALIVMAAFGAVAAVVVTTLTPWLVGGVLKVPVVLRPESLHAFYILALSMPFVITGSSFGGTLSAFQRFDLMNLVRVPAGILSYLAPLAILPFSHRIDVMVAAMVAVRVVGWVATFAMCLSVVPALRHPLRPSRAALRPMLSFGGWVTVSGIMSPIMGYFDRFLIGATVSVAAVAYYTVPQQITSKLGILPGAITNVAFPAFSGALATDPDRAALIFERAARYTLLALFTPVLLILLFATEGLSLWLGASFSVHAAMVFRWFAVTILIGATAWTPYALVQAAHRPDLTAKLHLVEVPFYLAILFWVLPRYGIDGAAVVYTARVTVDAIALLFMARRLLPQASGAVTRIAILASASLAVVGLGALPMGLSAKCTFATAVLIGFACAGWLRLLGPEEKYFVREWLRPSRIIALEPRR
jgi:O-antigen/teichoic acid export membrane protein